MGSKPSFGGFNLFFILTFIASHAVGQGAVIWVFISEIFPNSVRAAGQAWGTGTHWVFAALITMLGEVVIEAFPDGRYSPSSQPLWCYNCYLRIS